MPSDYPGAVDSFPTPATNDRLNNPSHTAHHNDIVDAIVAVQTAIGVNPPKITRSDTEPADPSVGDIWVDISDPANPEIKLAKEEE